MNNQPSPIETLRQLREMLDAGTITAAEFEALKQQLIFTAQAPPAPVAIPPAPDLTTPAEQDSPMFEDAQVPPGSADLEATPAPVAAPATPAQPAAANESASFSPAPARNPLNLVLAIGGLLVLLSVVAYLAFNQRESEHISSGSMTAADSLNMSVEEGPQAELVERTVAVPDTVRIAPTNPAPPVTRPAVAPAVRDSTAAMPAAVDSVKRP